jgi:hypothetical protein
MEPRDQVQCIHALGQQDTHASGLPCAHWLYGAHFFAFLLAAWRNFLVGAGGLSDPDLEIRIGIYSVLSTSAASQFRAFHLPCCKAEPCPCQLPARSTGHHCTYTMAMFQGPTAGCTLSVPALAPSISGVAATYSFARTHHDHTLALQVSW